MTELPIECRALSVMRDACDWKANRLAEALGMKPGTLSDHERGKTVPSRDLLERAAAAMRLPRHHVDRTLVYLRLTDAASASPNPDAEREIGRLVAGMGRTMEEVVGALFQRARRQALALVERQMAEVLWPRLRAYPPQARIAVVRENKDFQRWALSEWACHESIEAAAHDADEAVELAELAVVIADRLPETEVLRPRTQGYARFHLGNARRVKGRSLPEADVAFTEANDLWKAGAEGDPDGLLNEARVLGMEASLRRAQRRLDEAIKLLDQALAIDQNGERKYLLINRAKALEETGSHKGAIDALKQALPLVDGTSEPRLLWSLRFNMIVQHCHLGCHAEAEELLGDVRRMTLDFGYGLGLARLAWLHGWVHSGLGRPAEAEAAFTQARRYFLDHGISFDAALVSLELTVLYMEQGRTAEVKSLARELAPVFKAQDVTRETLATLLLFREAVEKETLTVDLARQFLQDFRRARSSRSSDAEVEL
jgi:tetratricopeptide (TPR) repeat protein/DNA-binding XRE family transcriptional regulator